MRAGNVYTVRFTKTLLIFFHLDTMILSSPAWPKGVDVDSIRFLGIAHD